MILPVKHWFTLLSAIVLLGNSGCTSSQGVNKEFPVAFTVEVTNPLNRDRENVLVQVGEMAIKRAKPTFNPLAFVVMDGAMEVPSQYNKRDVHHQGIALFLESMKPGETRQLTVRFNPSGANPRSYTKRTQAELSKKVGGQWENRKYVGGTFQNTDSLRVPNELTDHSYFLRYEGPGWESDKIGYRYYLDWRNAIDVFGKRTPDMVLQNVGLDGYDSYHEQQPWGMDVLKVGKALGVGTLALFDNGTAVRVEKTDSTYAKVTENGDVYSSILTDYYGWQVAGQKLNVQSLLSIHAGTRVTHHQIKVSGGQPQNLSTGLIKDKKLPVVKQQGEAGKRFGYLYTWGPQSLNTPPDNLGIAVLFHPKDFIAFSEDPLSHVVQLKPTEGNLEYYFLSAWELEANGIKTKEQFHQYMERTAEELAQPVVVKVRP